MDYSHGTFIIPASSWWFLFFVVIVKIKIPWNSYTVEVEEKHAICCA
jgi:hypothetical protein